MNICLVSREYPPETGWGGIGTYTYNLAHGLSELGNNVHVIAYAPEEEKSYFDKNVHIHRVKEINVPGIWRVDKYIPISLILYSIRVAQKINELVKKEHLDVIEFPNWYAEGFWYLFLTKHTVLTVVRLHTPYFEVLEIKNKKLSLNDKIICWLEKTAVLKSHSIITSTLAHSKNIANAYRINLEKIKIVPLGIDLKISRAKAVNNSQNNGAFNILFVSRLEKRKGIEVLFLAMPEIIEKYPYVKFWLVGKDTSNYQVLFRNKFGEKYTNSVLFLGYVKEEELENYYNSCDLFVVPSLYESFGLVYLEAMKYAKPVIGCKVGGIPEVVEDEKTGILVSPDNQTELCNKIAYLIENKDIRTEMGFRGRERMLKLFSRQTMVETSSKLYKELLSNANENYKKNVSSRDVWDKLWHKYEWQLDCDQIVRQKIMLFWIKSFLGKDILELGAGTGFNSLNLSKRGARVTCLDWSMDALRLIKRNFDNAGQQIDIIQGDVNFLPIANQSFDITFSAGLLEHFKNPIPLITEMVRVTRKGGFIICFVPQTFSWWTIRKRKLMKSHRRFAGWETNYSCFSLKKVFRHPSLRLIGIKGLHLNITPWDFYSRYYDYKKKGFLLRDLDSTLITKFLGKEIGIIVEKL